jgi:hypothetical protein
MFKMPVLPIKTNDLIIKAGGCACTGWVKSIFRLRFKMPDNGFAQTKTVECGVLIPRSTVGPVLSDKPIPATHGVTQSHPVSCGKKQ